MRRDIAVVIIYLDKLQLGRNAGEQGQMRTQWARFHQIAFTACSIRLY